MKGNWLHATVRELQARGILLVEDGNHGEQRPRSHEFVHSGVAFIRAADMDSGRVLFDQASKINEVARARITKGIGAAGDVLLSHKGTVGKVALVPNDAPPFVCSPQTTFWRSLDANALSQRFLYVYLRSPTFRQELVARSGETDMAPYVSLTSQRAIRLCFPPLPAQRVIACILGALDDKIELNRRMNETLEAMARALFQSWFVDFDPVRAKAEGRRPSGMDEDTRRLFPARLIETGEGDVPEGWIVVRVEDIAETVAMGPFGSNIKVDTFVDQGVPVISGKHLHGLMLEDCGYNFISIEHAERLRKCKVYRGDLIFTHAGTLGQVAYIPPHSQYSEYVISQRQFYLRCDRAKVPPVYMAYFFRSPEGQHRLLANVVSTGVPSIAQPVTYLRTIKVLLPGKAVLDKFEAVITRWHTMIGRNNAESATLIAIRDTLLPKLLSGELRIPEAEAAVGKAL